MEVELALDLSLVLVAALLGGGASILLRLPLLTGYIIAGIVFAAVAPLFRVGTQVLSLAQLGIILLLFTLGIELTLARIGRVFQVAVLGGLVQILGTTFLGIFILAFLGITGSAAFILAFAFSLSSTAVVVKLLLEKAEIDTLPGEILSGWLLVQDLAVVPVVVLLPLLAAGAGIEELPLSLGKSVVILLGVVILGRVLVPRFLQWVASFNSREFLLLSTAALVFATAGFVSLFGLSPAIGAFVAGLIVSETSQNHAVFAEIRPLREIFMVVFFVSLGALITPSYLFSSFGLILSLALIFILLKFFITFFLVLLFGYHARTAFWVAVGLANIGEFSFLLVFTAAALGIIDEGTSSLAISVTATTLILTPIIFKFRTEAWRLARVFLERSPLAFLVGRDRYNNTTPDAPLSDHVIICGFGRMGSWLGRACQLANIPFVVVEYNHKTVVELKDQGIPVVYGDPSDEGVLENVQVENAKLLIIAIPDRLTQELVINSAHDKNPKIEIISRAHHDEDRSALQRLGKVQVIQPEFEAALSTIHRVLQSYGMSRDEVGKRIKTIKSEHTKLK